jgi:NADH-quinone oxidoreductase subunit C
LSSEAEAPPTAATPAEPQPEEAPPVDQARQALVDALRSELGDDLVETVIEGGDVWARVAPTAWRRAVEVARDQLSMRYFCYLSAIDWKQNPELSGQKLWDPDAEAGEGPGDGPGHWLTGKAGGDTRFQLICRLYNVATHVGITFKADAGDEEPRIESLVPLFRGADWHERETWEMYGVLFEGHPGLRHLYLPTEFEGYPLRKDFPLLAREVKPWPGLVNVEGLPGEEEGDGEETAGEAAAETAGGGEA